MQRRIKRGTMWPVARLVVPSMLVLKWWGDGRMRGGVVQVDRALEVVVRRLEQVQQLAVITTQTHITQSLTRTHTHARGHRKKGDSDPQKPEQPHTQGITARSCYSGDVMCYGKM